MTRRLGVSVQLLLATVFAFGAFLVLVPAQTTLLWKLEILGREQGHWFALLALASVATSLLFPEARRSLVQRVAIGIVALSIPVLLVPVVQGLAAGRTLPAQLATFGDTTPRGSIGEARRTPVQTATLFSGVRLTADPPARYGYFAANGDSLALDFYPSSASGQSPLLVVIHGGSWKGGSRADLPELGRYLAERGYAVASVSYRFAPKHQYPAARQDVRRAIDFLQLNAQALKIDPSRVVLLGRSAGGHLALLSAYADRESGIRGVVALYPVIDLRWGYDHPTNPRVLNSTATLESFLGGSPAATGTRYDEASPLSYVDSTAPPTLLIHGDGDELVFPEHTRRLSARLTAAGRPNVAIELPWATHGCDYFIAGPCGQITLYAVERFLAAVTR